MVSYRYLFGVIEAAAAPQPLPLPPELRLAVVGRVAGVYEEVAADELAAMEPEVRENGPLAQRARRHDDVLTALALAEPAVPVLPVRLGTVFPDLATLTAVLHARERRLADALDAVRGRLEWGLRVASAPPVAAPPGGGSGTDYLLGRRDARRRVAELRSAIAAAVTALDERLTGLADAATRHAYLVHRTAEAAFLAAAEAGIAELDRLGCTATVRGPLPPYSFTDIRLDAA